MIPYSARMLTKSYLPGHLLGCAAAARVGGASCALRDTFFDHPVSVDTGTPKTLAHRAQVGESLLKLEDVIDHKVGLG